MFVTAGTDRPMTEGRRMNINIEEITTHERSYPTGYYVNGRHYPATAADRREYEHKTIVYFSAKGESIWDNLANRRRRPHLTYRELMPQVLERLGLPADTRFRWNVKAGCKMCPCSPGMVLDRRFTSEDGRPFDVWVTVTGEEHPQDYDPAKIAQQVMNLEVVEVPA